MKGHLHEFPNLAGRITAPDAQSEAERRSPGLKRARLSTEDFGCARTFPNPGVRKPVRRDNLFRPAENKIGLLARDSQARKGRNNPGRLRESQPTGSSSRGR